MIDKNQNLLNLIDELSNDDLSAFYSFLYYIYNKDKNSIKKAFK